MISRFSTLLLGAMFSLFSITLSAQGFAVIMDSLEAQSGEVICMPVKAFGFVDITSYQYSLSWDPDVLSFHHTEHYNLPGMSSLDFNEFPDDILVTAWSSPTGIGINRADGEVLYDVCFTVTGAMGSSTEISVGSNFPPSVGPAEAYNSNNENVWAPQFNVFGFVDVSLTSGTSDAGSKGSSMFELSPNPTHASAQVLLKSTVSGTATILVTDALGKTVFEQKTTLRAGENKFQIPAEALKAKGMYQVSLQTEQGVSSQMLSVH